MSKKVHRAFVEERNFPIGPAFVGCCLETYEEADIYSFSPAFSTQHEIAIEYLNLCCDAEHVL